MAMGESRYDLIMKFINTLFGLTLIICAFPVAAILFWGGSGWSPGQFWILLIVSTGFLFTGFGMLARKKFFWSIAIYLVSVFVILGIFNCFGSVDAGAFLALFVFSLLLLIFLLIPQVKKLYK